MQCLREMKFSVRVVRTSSKFETQVGLNKRQKITFFITFLKLFQSSIKFLALKVVQHSSLLSQYKPLLLNIVKKYQLNLCPNYKLLTGAVFTDFDVYEFSYN